MTRGHSIAESGVAKGEARHILERHPVHALLVEVVHVLAIGLAVGDDVEAEIALVLSRPAHHLVGLRLGERRLLHRVGGLGRARVAADHCVAVSRHPHTGLKARLLARFVDMRAHALDERARDEAGFLLDPSAVLPVDERRPWARLVEFEPGVRQPMAHGRRQFLGRHARAAVVVREMSERRLQSKADELLGAIVLVDPGVARLPGERQLRGPPQRRLGREMPPPTALSHACGRGRTRRRAACRRCSSRASRHISAP